MELFAKHATPHYRSKRSRIASLYETAHCGTAINVQRTRSWRRAVHEMLSSQVLLSCTVAVFLMCPVCSSPLGIVSCSRLSEWGGQCLWLGPPSLPSTVHTAVTTQHSTVHIPYHRDHQHPAQRGRVCL